METHNPYSFEVVPSPGSTLSGSSFHSGRIPPCPLRSTPPPTLRKCRCVRPRPLRLFLGSPSGRSRSFSGRRYKDQPLPSGLFFRDFFFPPTVPEDHTTVELHQDPRPSISQECRMFCHDPFLKRSRSQSVARPVELGAKLSIRQSPSTESEKPEIIIVPQLREHQHPS